MRVRLDAALAVALGVVACAGAVAYVQLQTRVAVLEVTSSIYRGAHPQAAGAPPMLQLMQPDSPSGPLVPWGPPGDSQPPPAPIEEPPVRCSGSLPDDDVVAVVRDQGRAVFECSSVANAPTPPEPVRLNLLVGTAGEVRAATVLPPVDGTELGRCIEARAMAWRFPVPTGDDCATVHVPLGFTVPSPL